MIILGKNSDNVNTGLEEMKHPKILEALKNVNITNIKKSQIMQLEKYTKKVKFNMIEMARQSIIYSYLCEWVLSIKELAYRHQIMKKVRPLLISNKLNKENEDGDLEFTKHYDAFKSIKIQDTFDLT